MNLRDEMSSISQGINPSIKSADRRSLLKAWGEMDVGFGEGPVDYLWLFYTAFYTAKGISKAKTFYVTRLSIWKESALRLSFFHEYLVATIRSTSSADQREYYLLFERTAGQLNTDKKTEEDLDESIVGQEDDELNQEENPDDFSFAPDRTLEGKFFGTGGNKRMQQSDDEAGPRSASSRGTTSPKSDGGAGSILGVFSAVRDSTSDASESSSGDLILADDRYQLIDHPYRSPSDIEVAWIILGKPDDSNPDPAVNHTSEPSVPPNLTTPVPPLSHTNPGQAPVVDVRQYPTSGINSLPVLTRGVNTHPQAPGLDALQRSASTGSDISYTSILTTKSSPPIGTRNNNHISLQASASLPLLEFSRGPDEQECPTPISPSHDVTPFPNQLPFATSNLSFEDIQPAPTGTAGKYPNEHSLSAEGFVLPGQSLPLHGQPLSRINTKLSEKSRSSKISRLSRLRRRSSFSTIHYDALPPLPPRNYIYLYELVVLACRLHKCKSLYRIFTRNCYWFVGMIFHVIRVFTGVDASISGEGDSVDRMKPSNEVMLWINSGRVGTFLRSVRIVKAPRLFTVYALIRKWHGAIVRFEDQVNVNFADSTPQQMRIIQLVVEAERKKREEAVAKAEAEKRKREEEREKYEEERKKYEEERKKYEEDREGAEAEAEKRVKAAVDEEKRKAEAEADEKVKAAIDEEKRKAEERIRAVEEERRKRDAEFQKRLKEMEKRMNEYKMALDAQARSPGTASNKSFGEGDAVSESSEDE